MSDANEAARNDQDAYAKARKSADTITALRAEVERLRAEAKANLDLAERHMDEKHRLRVELATVRAENEKLRAALKAISEVKPNWGSESEEMYELARAALDLPSGTDQ